MIKDFSEMPVFFEGFVLLYKMAEVMGLDVLYL